MDCVHHGYSGDGYASQRRNGVRRYCHHWAFIDHHGAPERARRGPEIPDTQQEDHDHHTHPVRGLVAHLPRRRARGRARQRMGPQAERRNVMAETSIPSEILPVDKLPEPYYQDDSVTLYHADNRDILPHLSGVGQVVTSPPYNLNGDGNKSAGTYFNRLRTGYASHSDDMPHVEYVAWQHDLLRQLWGTLSDDGAIYYNHKPRVGGDRVKLPFDLVPDDLPIRQVITWDRCSGFNRQFTYYCPSYEWILVLAKPAFRINTRSEFDLWRIPPEGTSVHPAPFPLALARKCVVTTDAQLVLDPFAGSGTTLRAAKDLGRKAIGIEVDERYCEITAKRLGQEVLAL